MANCPRCGTRLLPGALACINCELPLTPDPSGAADAPAGSPPPYQLPQPGYSPYAANPNWPPYGAPAPAYPQPGFYAPPGPAPWSTNGLAIAGLILSILWLGGLGSLLGVIFGHVARGQIRKRPQKGAGLALAALILGYLGLVGSVALYANIDRIINSGVVQNALVQEDLKDAASAEHDFLEASGKYTNDPANLSNFGFTPIGRNTIYAAYKSDQGFCLVGAHNGSNTWYLYDSDNGDLSDNTYSSLEQGESACSISGLSFAAIA